MRAATTLLLTRGGFRNVHGATACGGRPAYGFGKAIRLVFALLAAPAVASPPPSDDAFLAALHAADVRVATIGFRLAVAGAPLCRTTAPLAGLSLHDLLQYRPALRPAASRAFALGDRPGVMAVVAQGPADAAGLRAGDGLLAIDGAAVPADSPADRRAPTYAATARAADVLAGAMARGPVPLRVRRGAATLDLMLVPVTGCATLFQMVPSARAESGADGRTVTISSALYDELPDDDDLALVLAHELAHNALGHRAAREAAHVGSLPFGRDAARSRAAEAQADRLALYLMARAGFDPRGAPAFWLRLGARHGGVLGDPRHPGFRARAAAAEATVAEIEAKRAKGDALTP